MCLKRILLFFDIIKPLEREEIILISSYEKLIDNQKFKELKEHLINKMFNNSNIFDILNASNYEIRHSRYLAWLFKNSNLLELLSDKLELGFKFNNIKNVKIDVEYPVPEDNEFKKKGRIDILIESDNFVCVIENKYGSKEHDKQCKRYKKFVQEKFKNIIKENRKYIFLDIYKPDEELLKKGESLEDYVCVTYKDLYDIFEDKKFKLKRDDDFNKKVLEQYKDIINSNYDFNDRDKSIYSEVLKQDGVVDVLLKEYKYDESKDLNDCNTIWKLQSFMWATCLKKANEIIENIKNFEKLECFSENIGKNYGIYRCYPKGCNIKSLNFGGEYKPIMFIAISNNLSIAEHKELGINISIELAPCGEKDDEQRGNLYNAINTVLNTNYSTKIWKTIQQEQIISKKDYFEKILSGKTIDTNNVDETIDNIIKNYDDIRKLFEVANKIKKLQ